MKKRIVSLLFTIIFINFNLMAIGFGYHILDARVSHEFGLGFFPVSVRYQFDFPVPNIISGNDTILSVSFDNGMDHRTLNQHPDSGEFFDDNKSEEWYFDERDYIAHFDEFLLIFEQGFLGKTRAEENHLKLHFSFGGRFEMAFERLLWLYDSNSLSGVFWKNPNELRYPDSEWIGQPELAGDRKAFQTFINLGVSVNYLDDNYTIKNGCYFNSYLRYSPKWMPLNDGSADFLLWNNELKLAYTPVAIRQNGKDLTWFSLILASDSLLSYTIGNKVPYYAVDNNIYGAVMPNMELLFSNRTYMEMTGPQICVEDMYPAVSLFHDFAVSSGRTLNSLSDNKSCQIAASLGFNAKFIIYDIFTLFYEVGFIYKEPFNNVGFNQIAGKFGITVEV